MRSYTLQRARVNHAVLADRDLDSYNAGMISDEVLNEVTRRLVDGFHPEKIILFGSQARGTADDRSDVDILVICRFEGRRREVVLEMDRALRVWNWRVISSF